jgi:hypothetical protein
MTAARGLAAVVVAAALALAAAASPAGAAKEFVLDGGANAKDPAVAVDADGVAHIVWNERRPAEPSDVLHYCRVPRNGRSCQHKLTFTTPPIPNGTSNATDFPGPKVFAPGDGRVVIATSRCCPNRVNAHPLYVFNSADGGTSFSGPVEIGDIPIDGARLGPGPFALSGVTDTRTGGTFFQAAPLAGPPVTGQANLGAIEGDLVGAAYNGSIAFADPFTPIVAMDDLDRVYFRRFGGGTAYNDPAAWGPLTPVGAGDDARLAGLLSGKGGVHLLMRVGPGGRRRYVSRRYNGSGFDAPVKVSERGDPIFREFFKDASGRLHALWVNNNEDSLRHRSAPLGKPWGKTETLVKPRQAGDVYNLRSDAARDGGGFAVYDANGEGPIRAIQYGPKGPVGGGGGGGGDCVDEVTIGLVVVLAQEGCLQRKGDRYTTGDDVRVNGIDVAVGGGKLTIDKGERRLVTSGKVEARIAKIILGRQPLAWRLPQSTGPIKDLAGNPAEFETGAFGIDLHGLDVLGYTVPEVVGKGKVAVPVNLKLPAPFSTMLGDNVSGRVVLHATNEGVDLGALDVEVKDVSLGIAEIKDFTFHFVSGPPELLQAETDILVPPAYSGLGIHAAFGLRDGEFDYGNGAVTFGDNQLLIATDVLLKRIAFAVEAARECERPTKIGGDVTLTTGPELAGASLIEISGGASFSFPQGKCGRPGVFEIHGEGKLVGLRVLTLESRFTTDLQFQFKTALDVDLEAARARLAIEGGLDIPAGAFYAAGQADLELFGFEVFGVDTIVSNEGMAACNTIPGTIGLKATFEYRWGGDPGFDLDIECGFDISEYKPAAFGSAAAAAHDRAHKSQGPGGFTLPRGLRSAVVRLDGAGGAPGFVLGGPKGLRIAAEPGVPLRGRGFQVLAVPNRNQAFVRLAAPRAGRYTLTGAAGPPISAASVARGLPMPSVRGSVRRGRDGARVLSYRLRPIDGQRVTFVEEGRGVRNILASARRPRGRVRFTPASGPRGRRTVFAIVEQGGMPRARLRIARYSAPGYTRPGRPRRLRLHRRGGRLVVTWRRGRDAARHVVSWALRDGRRQARVTRRRRLVIGGVPGIDGGTIKVAGLRRDNVAGPAARAKLKPKPKRVKHKRKARKRRR